MTDGEIAPIRPGDWGDDEEEPLDLRTYLDLWRTEGGVGGDFPTLDAVQARLDFLARVYEEAIWAWEVGLASRVRSESIRLTRIKERLLLRSTAPKPPLDRR